jgi:hypothetical protein
MNYSLTGPVHMLVIVQTSALPVCRLYHLTEFKNVIMGTAYLHVPAHILYSIVYDGLFSTSS